MSRNQAVRSKSSRAHIDFAGAVIPYSDLSDTNLSSSIFDGTTLSHADLSGTDFTEASLVGAVLIHANLSNTNLSHADLRRADLTGANLTGADLDGTVLGNAKLRGADLRNARNALWNQLLDTYIDEHTKLPDDLDVDALNQTLDLYSTHFDVRHAFGLESANRDNLISGLLESAGDRTIMTFVCEAASEHIDRERAQGRSSAGLNDEPGEYKDE